MKVYMLPTSLTIYEASDVHKELEALVMSEEMVQLDASQVEEIDTSGIQLMLWFRQKLDQHNQLDRALLKEASHIVETTLELLSLHQAMFANPIDSSSDDDLHRDGYADGGGI